MQKGGGALAVDCFVMFCCFLMFPQKSWCSMSSLDPFRGLACHGREAKHHIWPSTSTCVPSIEPPRRGDAEVSTGVTLEKKTVWPNMVTFVFENRLYIMIFHYDCKQLYIFFIVAYYRQLHVNLKHLSFFFSFQGSLSRFGLSNTFFVMILLVTASLMFTNDANRLVLRPVEKMISRIEAFGRSNIDLEKEDRCVTKIHFFKGQINQHTGDFWSIFLFPRRTGPTLLFDPFVENELCDPGHPRQAAPGHENGRWRVQSRRDCEGGLNWPWAKNLWSESSGFQKLLKIMFSMFCNLYSLLLYLGIIRDPQPICAALSRLSRG